MLQDRARERAQAIRACKHLLRHLWDATALSRNPLAKAFLLNPDCSHSDLRATIAAICEELTHSNSSSQDERLLRRKQIVLRCDLGREGHDQVARDLGLSMRQFYRERREIREQIAGALLKRLRLDANSGTTSE